MLSLAEALSTLSHRCLLSPLYFLLFRISWRDPRMILVSTLKLQEGIQLIRYLSLLCFHSLSPDKEDSLQYLSTKLQSL